MANHFNILVHVPQATAVSDAELIRYIAADYGWIANGWRESEIISEKLSHSVCKIWRVRR